MALKRMYGEALVKTMMRKIAEILTVAKYPILKDNIKHKCRMSSTSIEIYLKHLLEAGLLDAYPAIDLRLSGRPSKHRMTYQTSRKGQLFLRKLDEIYLFFEINSNGRENNVSY